MPDEQTPPAMGDTPAAAPATAPAMDAAASSPAPTLAELQAELERTSAALKNANKESAERRKRLADLEKAETDRKAAELSDVDRLKAELETIRKEADDAKQQRLALVRERAVEREARQLAIFADGAIADLSTFLPADLDADNAGDVIAALKKLATARPYLLRQASQPGDINAGARGKSTDLVSAEDEARIKQRYRL